MAIIRRFSILNGVLSTLYNFGGGESSSEDCQKATDCMVDSVLG